MAPTEEDHLPKISEGMEHPGQMPGGNASANSNIRRYLVLLHDCICIKFITVQQAQQRKWQKSQSSNNNFHQQQHHQPCCHCSCSNEYGSNTYHQATSSPVASSQYDICGNKKGSKCDWKSNNPMSNEDSLDKGDHQECQLNRNQMGYHHHHADQSSQVKGSAAGRNDESSLGTHVNHQNQSTVINNNKSNRSTSSSVLLNNKGDYEVISNHNNHCCSKCSNGTTEWESKKLNDQLGDAKGTLRSVKDEHCLLHSGNNTIYRSSIMSKVDHSMQALFLYKEFRDINMSCFWNSAVHDAFKNLEYKGSIVPSTIIVGSPVRKHLTVLKTAWSRKMLRSPSGYEIDFLGEIEELIADPIGKSHFVPLSDSLCWAIHELTSSGQEAFVDDILLNLASSPNFSQMILPTKELIYQTLEKLTRERKIYQTPMGYFVVTPETHRYIMSTEPLLMQAARQEDSATAANLLRNTLLLQQVAAASVSTPSPPSVVGRPTSPLPQNDDNLQEKRSKDKNEFEQVEPLRSNAAPSPDPDTYSLPYGTFRRYNSLRIRKSASGTGCLPRRTLSMRLPKSKSKNGSKNGRQQQQDVTGSFQNLDSSQVVLQQQLPQQKNKQLLSRRRKHKSFLSRLLSFRGVRKSSSTRKDKSGRGSSNSCTQTTSTKPLQIPRNDKTNSAGTGVLITKGLSNEPIEEESKCSGGNSNLATISTQTSFSIENLNGDLHLLTLGSGPGQSKSSTLDREDSDSGRCTDSHSDADAEIAAALNRGLTPIMQDHHHHHHHFHHHPPPPRRSGSCNVYEKIESDLGLKVDVDEGGGCELRSPSSQMSVSPMFSRGNFPRHNMYNRCHSSASSSGGNSYRDFYNLYRRRYPSYQQSTPTPTPTSESENIMEQLRFRPNHPIRYPPRSFERKQIFDEISRSSFKEKKNRNGGNAKTVSISTDNNNITNKPPTGFRKNIQTEDNDSAVHSTTSFKTTTAAPSSSPSTSRTTTTYLTQTLKNTTNLELEFRLPLGNIFNAAMNKAASSNDKSSPSEQSGLSSGHNESETGQSQKKSVSSSSPTGAGGDCTLSEVNTTVNDLFTIKSFVKSNPFSDELSSTIEFKARSNSNNNITNCGSNSKAASNYVIEAVSSKPYTDIHTKFNRESEII